MDLPAGTKLRRFCSPRCGVSGVVWGVGCFWRGPENRLPWIPAQWPASGSVHDSSPGTRRQLPLSPFWWLGGALSLGSRQWAVHSKPHPGPSGGPWAQFLSFDRGVQARSPIHWHLCTWLKLWYLVENAIKKMPPQGGGGGRSVSHQEKWPIVELLKWR